MALAITCTASAQDKKEYPKPEAMRPGMSEYWTPQPKVVTPGDIKTNTADRKSTRLNSSHSH